jgi:alkaline phosphatase D
VHSFWVTDLHADPSNRRSPIVATEFVTTSITSQTRPTIDAVVSENPHVRFASGAYRGYTRIDLGPQRAEVELRAMESVATPDAPCRTLARFSVQDGRPGASEA